MKIVRAIAFVLVAAGVIGGGLSCVIGIALNDMRSLMVEAGFLGVGIVGLLLGGIAALPTLWRDIVG